MKLIYSLFVIAACLFVSSSVFARSEGFAGFTKGQTATSFFAGQPLFVRYSNFIDWKKAWSVDAGYHFDSYPYFALNYASYFYNVKDHLRQKRSFFNSLLFYIGPGVFIGPDFGEEKSDEKIKMGIRAFGGVEYIFRNSPLSFTAEIGPAFFIEGDDFVGFQGMLGVTYYIGGIKQRVVRSKIRSVKPVKKDPLDDVDAREFREFD